MTIHEALPGITGKADWQDYKDYWRDADATWIQDRIILRVTTAQRDSTTTPLGLTPGAVIYNSTLDQLQLKKADGSYASLTPLPTSLTTSEISGKTTIGHVAAGGTGLTFTATEVGVSSNFNVLNGVLTVNPTGVSVKTGAKTAKLTTDAANLVVDSPVSAPGVTITSPGTLSAAGRPALVGALTADSATVNGVLTAGINSIIGGVTAKGGWFDAPSGYVSSNGYFHGQSDSALMRFRNASGGALGSSYLQVTQTDVISQGGSFYMNSALLIRGGRAVSYYDSANNLRGYISPSLYSASDPGAANFPEGTIWVQ